jgi:hypothetical protein
MASLPRPDVSPDFADRVVRAAVAEAEKYNEARGVVSRAPPVERHFWRRWKFGAAAASAAALAACLLLAVLVGKRGKPGGGGNQPGEVLAPAVATVASLPDQLLAALSSAAPKNRDAVVLRLKAGKGVSIAEALDAALGKAGIGALANDAAGRAAMIQEAYRASFEAAQSGGTGELATATAAQAVFIEAPLASLQGAIADLASAVKDPLELQAGGNLALRGMDDERAEGESGSAVIKPFAQRLDGSLFRLLGKSAAGGTVAAPPLAAALQPNQPIRVLLLIEPQ